MKNISQKLLLSSLISTLVACGGSSDSGGSAPTTPITPSTPVSIQGTAIDGYLVGATVFLDLNWNGELDEGEPSSTTVEPTETTPGWTLEGEGVEECLDYAPIITKVEVGVIDLDKPNEPISEPYELIYPPKFAITGSIEDYNVTPLTTVVWQGVKSNIEASGEELSCEKVAGNTLLQGEITNDIAFEEQAVSRRYNVSIESLYSDFIADGDSELHTLAQAIVPGLSQAFSETAEIIAEQPNSLVIVEYYFDSADDVASETWTRRQYVSASRGNWEETTNSMIALGDFGPVIQKASQSTTTVGTIEAETSVNFNGGACSVSEYLIEYVGDYAYGISNINIMSDVTWNVCEANEVSEGFTQMHITKELYDDGAIKVQSGHYMEGDNVITTLIGLTPSEVSVGTLEAAVSGISLSFDDEESYGAGYWVRHYNEFTSNAQVIYIHDSDDVYRVETYNSNGTYDLQCGLWSVGDSSLTACTE